MVATVEAASVVFADGSIPGVGVEVLVKEVAARVIHDAIIAAASGVKPGVASAVIAVVAVGSIIIGVDVIAVVDNAVVDAAAIGIVGIASAFIAVAAVSSVVVKREWHMQCIVAAVNVTTADTTRVIHDAAFIIAAAGIFVVSSVTGWRRKASSSRGGMHGRYEWLW